jgi:hypothetical protein
MDNAVHDRVRARTKREAEREGKYMLRLKLTFVAERPPPPHVADQEVLAATERGGEYFS